MTLMFQYVSMVELSVLKLKFWGVKQNSIPNMWQVVFANISVKGWMVGACIDGFFYSYGKVLFFPSHYAEIANS